MVRLLPPPRGSPKSFCLPQINEGGDAMEYITWHDLIEIALLVFAIISCFYNKNKKDNRCSTKVSGYLFNHF